MRGASFMIKGPLAEATKAAHLAKLEKHPDDSGIDLFPLNISEVNQVGSRVEVRVDTGVHILFPEGTFGLLMGRSSTVKKMHGADAVTANIDSGYTGRLVVRFLCARPDFAAVHEAILTQLRDRTAIAQVVPVCYMVPKWIEWSDEVASTSGRGDKGFGSTDKMLPDPRYVDLDSSCGD